MSSNRSRPTPVRQLARAAAALRRARRDLESAAAARDDPAARFGHQAGAVAGLRVANAALAALLAESGPVPSPADPAARPSCGR